MLNWKDRKYINPRKKVFKNLDTNEILNLEIQDDLNNIQEESETPLTAHNLNLAQQELLEDTHKYFMKATTTIQTDTNLTIPCNYKVGVNVLDVYLMGEKLIKTTEEHAGHYKEVGEVGSISNTIQLDSINEDGTSEDWQVEAGEYFEFVVRGEYNET